MTKEPAVLAIPLVKLAVPFFGSCLSLENEKRITHRMLHQLVPSFLRTGTGT